MNNVFDPIFQTKTLERGLVWSRI